MYFRSGLSRSHFPPSTQKSTPCGILLRPSRASPVPNSRTSPFYHPSLFDGRVSLTDDISYPTYNPYSYERMTDPTVVWRTNEAKQAFVLAGNYASPDFVCHVNGSPASDFIEVRAGDPINLQWTKWPTSHIGPAITYMANAKGDFTKVDKVNLAFVKIEELGLIHNSTNKKAKPEGYYATNKLIDAGDKWTITVPAYVAPGNYIIRHELIALMGAVHLGHAQHYPQCINVKVTGNGKDPLYAGTRAKDLYKPTDPGIQIMIYQDLDYKIPGPKLYKPRGGAPGHFYETEAAISLAPPAPAPSAGFPLTTLISVPSSAPHRGVNATAFPPYHPKPVQTPAAASSSPSKPANTPSLGKAGQYTYDLSGVNDENSATEDGDETESGAEQNEGNGESTSTGKTQGPPDGAGSYQGTTKQTGAPKTYNYSGPEQETKPTPTPTKDETSSFSPEDFDLPKGASIEQIIAFLETLLGKLKDAVLNKKRSYARDFSMH